MTPAQIAGLAGALDEARLAGRAIDRLSLAHAALGLEDAYLIQEEGMRLRLARGDKAAGLKMGLTSKAKMEQMGVKSPIRGILSEEMRLSPGGALSLSRLIHPRIEPEIAFIIGRDLNGPQSPEAALEACSGVCAAMEVIDSRFKAFNFTLPDVIADNTSCCAFVLGEIRDPRRADLADLRMTLEINGQAVQEGTSAAIYGHPANSLFEVCSMMAAQCRAIKAGSVVLAGAATQAVALAPGMKVRAIVETLGTVALSVE